MFSLNCFIVRHNLEEMLSNVCVRVCAIFTLRHLQNNNNADQIKSDKAFLRAVIVYFDQSGSDRGCEIIDMTASMTFPLHWFLFAQ